MEQAEQQDGLRSGQEEEDAERISERMPAQIVDVPVPQIAAKIPEVVGTTSERIENDLQVPQVVKENREMIKVPQDCVSKSTGEHKVDVIVPHVELAESSGEAGSSWSSARPLLVQLGLLGSQSTVPRRVSTCQCHTS